MEMIAERLFSDGAKPQLIGGRERATGRVVFPLPDDEARFEAIALPAVGTIWSWSVQRFRPKSPPYAGPEAFEPFGIAYVQLGDAVIVETRLSGFAFDQLKVGLPCRLVIEELGGKRSFAFAPMEGAS
jgi:uncharacterized protein